MQDSTTALTADLNSVRTFRRSCAPRCVERSKPCSEEELRAALSADDHARTPARRGYRHGTTARTVSWWLERAVRAHAVTARHFARALHMEIRSPATGWRNARSSSTVRNGSLKGNERLLLSRWLPQYIGGLELRHTL
jgi:hypothetical protein